MDKMCKRLREILNRFFPKIPGTDYICKSYIGEGRIAKQELASDLNVIFVSLATQGERLLFNIREASSAYSLSRFCSIIW